MVQWGIAYVAASWGFLQGLEYVTGSFQWPHQVLRRKDFPAGVRVSLGDSPDAVLMRGGSAIINPFGKVLAGPIFDAETILRRNSTSTTSAAASSTSTWSAITAGPTSFN